jgi:hypothetical protein
MLKILSAEQIREADAFTIKNEPIASIITELAPKRAESIVSTLW